MKKNSQLEKYGMSLINLCKLINDRQLTIITDKTYLSANDLIIFSIIVVNGSGCYEWSIIFIIKFKNKHMLFISY